ncbi:MAG: SDR family NAD(P)-dependent oxidoreductase [Candidatus Binataceae bacterium]
MRLQKKVAVIIGGASGMGREITMRFLEERASVVIVDYNEDTGKQTPGVCSRTRSLRPV